MASILVVDDEPDIRDLIRIDLELDGHEVTTAADGAEALLALGRRLPDLVLLDLAMPELDGWGVLTAMKGRDDGLGRTPVVVLTAHDSVDNRIRGGIEGALRCLPKPFRLDQLRSAVHDALSGGPEPAQRRRAQAAALEQLARQERGGDPTPGLGSVRLHLTRLERPRALPPPAAAPATRGALLQLGELTEKQRTLLDTLARSASVSAAAAELGMSRSNLYATLRRVARRLGVASVSEVVLLVRGTELPDGLDP